LICCDVRIPLAKPPDLNPTRADATVSALSIVPVAGGLELRWTSIRALTDVQLGLEECTSLGQWGDSPVITAEKRESLPDGRIRRSYLFAVDPAVRSRFFRLRPALVQSLITGEHIPFR
jgi:hypothetical protein